MDSVWEENNSQELIDTFDLPQDNIFSFLEAKSEDVTSNLELLSAKC